MDPRDRLILALSALVAAEREARDATQALMRSGTASDLLIGGLAGNPASFVDAEDIQMAEAFVPPSRAPIMHGQA